MRRQVRLAGLLMFVVATSALSVLLFGGGHEPDPQAMATATTANPYGTPLPRAPLTPTPSPTPFLPRPLGPPPQSTVTVTLRGTTPTRIPGTEIDVVPFVESSPFSYAGGDGKGDIFVEAGEIPRLWRQTKSGMELLADDGRVLRTVEGAGMIYSASVGGAIVYTAADPRAAEWTLETGDGRSLTLPAGAAPSFSLDGTSLAYYTAVTASREPIEGHVIDLTTLVDRLVIGDMRQCDPYCEGRNAPIWSGPGTVRFREYGLSRDAPRGGPPRQWVYNTRTQVLEGPTASAIPGADSVGAGIEFGAPKGEYWYITEPSMDALPLAREIAASGEQCSGIRFFFRHGTDDRTRCVPLRNQECRFGDFVAQAGLYPAAFSPDSTLVHLITSCQSVVVDLVSGTMTTLPGATPENCYWSSDGRFLLFGRASFDVRERSSVFVFDGQQRALMELLPEQGLAHFTFGIGLLAGDWRLVTAFWSAPQRIVLAVQR